MNSPCIVVSQVRTSGRSMSLANGDSSSAGWAPWLLNPQCPGRSPNSNAPLLQSDIHRDSFVNITEQDIPNIMDRYRNLMFDFTFPETVDFHDLLSGQLAATHRSTVVAEHGWKLWELVKMLKSISTLDDRTSLDRHVAKVEASLSEVRFWVEEQRTQQLIQEAGEGLVL
ncbi:hypothetical protein RSAG8_13743, partial [Rhizoctonia solani AG-8 WAC10335]